MKKPTLLIAIAISHVLDEYKLFAKVPHPLIKFDEKHDGEVTEPVQRTILKIGPIFMQKWCLDHPKMILDQFSQLAQIWQLWKQP